MFNLSLMTLCFVCKASTQNIGNGYYGDNFYISHLTFKIFISKSISNYKTNNISSGKIVFGFQNKYNKH